MDSLSDGIVEKVFVEKGTYVHEWEPLFLIKTANGAIKKIEMGVSGVISKVNVEPGERVCSDMTLALLEEDTVSNGCD